MTEEEITEASKASLELHRDILRACAKHNLNARDTIYTLCITAFAAAEGAGVSDQAMDRIISKCRSFDLLPLLTPLIGFQPRDSEGWPQ